MGQFDEQVLIEITDEVYLAGRQSSGPALLNPSAKNKIGTRSRGWHIWVLRSINHPTAPLLGCTRLRIIPIVLIEIRFLPVSGFIIKSYLNDHPTFYKTGPRQFSSSAGVSPSRGNGRQGTRTIPYILLFFFLYATCTLCGGDKLSEGKPFPVPTEVTIETDWGHRSDWSQP